MEDTNKFPWNIFRGDAVNIDTKGEKLRMKVHDVVYDSKGYVDSSIYITGRIEVFPCDLTEAPKEE